jgi:hypothetical protein
MTKSIENRSQVDRFDEMCAIRAWRAEPLGHVFGNCRLRDLKPKLEQLAVDAWRAPKRILDAHPSDQHAELCLDLWPPSPRA